MYREFDIEARKLGVFKVETVGDCYVAVTGLPDPRDDHAIVIAKYAVRCLLKFNVLTKRLEANLGPGTASLGMRFGLHSGPVTAGVLRGEKSRFQLFGDTINVVSIPFTLSCKCSCLSCFIYTCSPHALDSYY